MPLTNEQRVAAGLPPLVDSAAPIYNAGRQVPPDLIAKGSASGTGVNSAETAAYSQIVGDVNAKTQPEYFKALRRQGYFVTQPFNIGTTVERLRPFESRTYLFIQNLSTVGDLYVGFGTEPNATYGLTLIPGAAYEPFTVPTNEIYIVAANAGTTGFIIYSRESD